MDLPSAFGGIRACVADHVEGRASGDRAHIARATHAGACPIALCRSMLDWESRSDLAVVCAGQTIPADAPVPPREIGSVSVEGETAAVRVTKRHAGERFRDTRSRVALPAGWTIVAKVFRNPA